MTEGDLLEHIFERLCRADSGQEIFGADEAAQWPESALEVLVKSGLLGHAEPAQVIECDGCERNCFMPVHVRPAEANRPHGLSYPATNRKTWAACPWSWVLRLNRHGLKADRDALLRLVDGDARQPPAGMGSVAWRKQTAKAAANARHNQPGGSRDKRRQIREIWATGKYTSRDICAEEEYAALGMSFSAARKALRNA